MHNHRDELFMRAYELQREHTIGDIALMSDMAQAVKHAAMSSDIDIDGNVRLMVARVVDDIWRIVDYVCDFEYDESDAEPCEACDDHLSNTPLDTPSDDHVEPMPSETDAEPVSDQVSTEQSTSEGAGKIEPETGSQAPDFEQTPSEEDAAGASAPTEDDAEPDSPGETLDAVADDMFGEAGDVDAYGMGELPVGMDAPRPDPDPVPAKRDVSAPAPINGGEDAYDDRKGRFSGECGQSMV